MIRLNLILILSLLAPISLQAQTCDNAFDRAISNGPLDEENIQYKLLCKEPEVTSSRKGIKNESAYVCVAGGLAKHEMQEFYGKYPMAAIYTDDPNSDLKKQNPLIGFWYVRKGKIKEEKNLEEEVIVSISKLGTKIVRKKSTIGSRSSHILEKIEISQIENTLRYQLSNKQGNSWKLKTEKVLDCTEVKPEEIPPPPKPKSITSGTSATGIATGTKSDSGLKRGYDPAASGISGTK